MICMKLGEKIPVLAKRMGTSQAELARALGTYPSRVSEWVAGTGQPSVQQALRIARYFGVTLDYLADEDANEPPTPLRSEAEKMIWAAVTEIGPEEAFRRLLISNREPRVVGGKVSYPPAPERKDVG